jgi:hypothetical protein
MNIIEEKKKEAPHLCEFQIYHDPTTGKKREYAHPQTQKAPSAGSLETSTMIFSQKMCNGRLTSHHALAGSSMTTNSQPMPRRVPLAFTNFWNNNGSSSIIMDSEYSLAMSHSDESLFAIIQFS